MDLLNDRKSSLIHLSYLLFRIAPTDLKTFALLFLSFFHFNNFHFFSAYNKLKNV